MDVHELRTELLSRIQASPRGTQAALARRMDINRGYLGNMLHGRAPMALERLQQIMDALNVELELTVKPADPTPAPPSRGEGGGGG